MPIERFTCTLKGTPSGDQVSTRLDSTRTGEQEPEQPSEATPSLKPLAVPAPSCGDRSRATLLSQGGMVLAVPCSCCSPVRRARRRVPHHAAPTPATAAWRPNDAVAAGISIYRPRANWGSRASCTGACGGTDTTKVSVRRRVRRFCPVHATTRACTSWIDSVCVPRPISSRSTKIQQHIPNLQGAWCDHHRWPDGVTPEATALHAPPGCRPR